MSHSGEKQKITSTEEGGQNKANNSRKGLKEALRKEGNLKNIVGCLSKKQVQEGPWGVSRQQLSKRFTSANILWVGKKG